MNRLLLTTAYFWLFVQPTGAAVQLHSLLLSGSQAPGAPAGVNFSSFDVATINRHGQISFWAELSNGRAGIWSNSTGALEALAIEGNPAPGTPARVYSTILPAGIGENGHTAFTSLLTGGTSQVGAFVGMAGSVQNVARTNGTVPGYPAEFRFTSVSWPTEIQGGFSSPAISPAGAIAFFGGTSYSGEELRHGIWTNRSGMLAPVLESGQPAPDYPAGSIIGRVGDGSSTFEPAINGHGHVASIVSVALPTAMPMEQAIIVERDSGMHVVASTSSTVPGADPLARYSRFEEPSLNNHGEVAFKATLQGSSITPDNDTGIWTTAGGDLHQIAREGDQAPGASPGAVFSDFARLPSISGDRRVLVRGSLSGPGIDPTRDSGLWMEQSGILEMVFQEGMQAPGFAPGLVLTDSSDIFSLIYGYNANATGHLAFRHAFGPGNGVISGNGIFMADDAGQVDAVAWTGQTVEPLPGVFKTISSVSILELWDAAGGQDDATSLNDAGQLIMSARYTDGTRGILMATIPEPASFTVLFLAASLLLRQSKQSVID